MLLSKYQHLRDQGKCTSILGAYATICELKKKYLEEFSATVLKIFKVDFLDQVTQISTILLDLNQSELEFSEKEKCISTVFPP